MATNRPITFGGVGATLTAQDILCVATGAPVSLDPSGLERVKKYSIKKAGQDSSGVEASPSGSQGATGEVMLEHQARAVQAVRLMTLMKGGQCLAGVEALAAWLNSNCAPALPAADADFTVLAALARSLSGEHDVVSSDPDPPSRPDAVVLAGVDLGVFQSGTSASAGVAAVVVQSGKMLLEVANGVAGLTCEALGAHVKGFDADNLESSPYKSTLDVADDLRCLMEGSSLVNPKKGGIGAPRGVLGIPVYHGACRDALSSAYIAVRSELGASALDLNNVQCGCGAGLSGSPGLASALVSVCQGVVKAGAGSLERIDLLVERLPGLKPIQGKPGAEGGSTESEGVNGATTELLSVIQPFVAKAKDRLSQSRAHAGDVAKNLTIDEDVSGVRVALVASECVNVFMDLIALESVLAVLSLRAIEGPAPVIEEQEPDANEKKSKKGKKKGKGMVVGKGSGVLRSAVESCLMGSTDILDDGVKKTIAWPFEKEVTSGSALSTFLKGGKLFDPLQGDLPSFAKLVRSLIEANQVQRKPKIAKGTRDCLPEQMQIREKAFNTITNIFKQHGAVSIDTPIFELRETLMGKYGEDSKLIYDLADQGGEILSLRYDLTVPFARFVALQGVGNIKRYHIGKVYRRDQPQMTRGRFREFFQCDFDIAGSYSTMVPDAEVIKVLVEILSSLELGEFEVKLNHRKLLDATMAISGVPPNKFRTICSAIDKLDKETWETVRREMVEDKGLAPEVADKVGELVKLRGRPLELLETLMEPEHIFYKNPDSKVALEELKLLFGFLEAMNALGPVTLDLSLARGLDYYSGVIYEAVLKGGNVGSIAAGGRYDKLVGMFSGKDVPAVGVSIGIERVFSIMEGLLRAKAEQTGVPIRAAETQVLVSSIGNNMQTKRMEICAELWAAGIKAEFGFKPNPKMGDQLNYVLENGIPYMVLFGGDELEKGIVKIKNIDQRTEEEVRKDNLVSELSSSLGI